MDLQDRELLSSLADRMSTRAKTPASALLEQWTERLAARPHYLVRWLATAASTDPAAVEQLFAELAWVELGPRARSVVDPDHTRQAAALHRFQSAAALFDQPGLTPEEERRFTERFGTVPDAVESLLWVRTSDATYLALLELLGLSRRPPPSSEHPG